MLEIGIGLDLGGLEAGVAVEGIEFVAPGDLATIVAERNEVRHLGPSFLLVGELFSPVQLGSYWPGKPFRDNRNVLGISGIIGISGSLRKVGVMTTGSSAGMEDLLEDLKFLRKGEGATPERLAVAGNALQDILGGETVGAQTKLDRLVSAIESLRDEHADVLMAAYRLSTDTAGISTLKQRREIYGATIGRGVDTVTSRENAALKELRVQLMTGWYPISPLPGKVPEAHNGYMNVSTHQTTMFSDGRWMETRNKFVMLALFDSFDYYAVHVTEPLAVTAYNGWRAEHRELANGVEVRFYPPEPITRGELAVLEYKTSAPPNDPGRCSQPRVIYEESLGFHERTLKATFEAVFLGEKPKLIYYFSGLTFHQRPGPPSPDRILSADDSSRVKVTVKNLYGGLYAGIAWEW